MPTKAVVSFAAVLLALPLHGCYPMHASLGHLDLMARRQPLASAAASAGSGSELEAQLRKITAIREFASRELALPDNGSYRIYAPLDRDYPVWNVWVTPEFDLDPRQSCFPVVGCVPYRGYYSKRLAEEYAGTFKDAGDDVMVGGVIAYSSLGFFDDPVTPAMLHLPEERLAGLVFHELAHQTVYVKGNATFNESFARAVEIEGTLRWLASRGDPAGLAHYHATLARAEIFFRAVTAVRSELAKLYSSPLPDSLKRRHKQEIFDAMRELQRQRKAQDPAWAAYDPWFADGLNNAKLAAVATYFDDVERFRELFDKVGRDFDAFYEAVALQATQLAHAADGSG